MMKNALSAFWPLAKGKIMPTRVPRLRKLYSVIGWGLFLIHTIFIVGAISVQGLHWTKCGHLLVSAFPVVIAVTIALAGLCTVVAAIGFGTRYGHIRLELESVLQAGRPEDEFVRHSASMPLSVSFPSGTDTSPGCVQVTVSSFALPVPYDGLSELEIGFEIPRYLDLLAAERKSARAALGHIAGALAGSSVAGIVTFGRLVEFLTC